MPYRKFYKIKTNEKPIRTGSLLLPEPFLRDAYFFRSVVLLVNHNEKGSMGLTLDKRLPMYINDFIPEFKYQDEIPLYNGGPVGTDNLLYIHSLEEIRNSFPIGDGLFLNGHFDDVKKYILQRNPVEGYIRFFRGYSGWEGEQLEEEIKENSWLVAPGGNEVLTYDKERWRKVMASLGGKYAVWARFPVIPAFN